MDAMQPVLTKSAMYRHLFAGRFGNFLQSFDNPLAARRANFRGPLTLRHKNVSNITKLYHLTVAEAIQHHAWLTAAGHDPRNIITQEAPPDDKRSIQGELSRNHRGLYLLYTFVPKPMRVALLEQSHEATGLRALGLLRYHLDPADVDDLMELLDVWQPEAIEFSSFTVPCGVLRRRTVVWETRSY